jgi:hypothetical protein
MADIQVANTDSDLSGNTVVTEENAYTITGLHTFSRSTNAPFAIVSGAAVVANLDADKLDGLQATAFVKADGSIALSANWDAGGYEIRSNTFESDVATGTIPLVIASTTKCTNLNADKLDDQEGTYYLAAANATGTLAVGKGGTGATSLTDGGVLLGSGTSAITATAVLGDGVILIGDASGDPATLDVGSSSGITILGTVATGVWQGTDVGVAYGGTGVSTFTDGGVLLGSGASAITAMAVLTDGQMIVGDGTGDPVAESGATLRTSIGVGTGDSPQFTGLTVSGTGASSLDVGGGLNIGTGDVSLVGTDGKISGPLSSTIIDDLSGANLTTLNAGNISSGTLGVARGGTGAATHTTGRLLIGKGTGAIADTGDATLNGDITVSGTGPHAIGSTAVNNYRLHLAGNWTSGGAGSRSTGTYIDGVITGHSGGETFIEGINCANEFVTAAGETITRLANLAVGAASITVGSGGTVTKAASFYVGGASTGAATNLAVWIDEGNVQIDDNLVIGGSLSKGSGSFRIRHPLPAKNATHELVHSFIEGPQCDLIYRGSATLVSGEATVNLDTESGMTEGTWVLLCRDEQCFTSNETGWSSVRGSVSGNILTIECQDVTSTDTISWMVVAERHDDHIKATDWTDADGHVIIEPEQAEEESA